jgi:S-adenosylmethionine decarboxylase
MKIRPRISFFSFKEGLVQLNEQLKLGEHFICDLSGCNVDLLYDSERARDLFFKAVRKSRLTVIQEGFYKFSPHGFTCFLLLAESHASLHAWPEHGYCAIDLFTCSLSLDITPLVQELQDLFGAAHCSIRNVDRNAVVKELCLA